MRLFHVSEEADIEVFHPRTPKRQDISQEKGLVWALNERCLPNFLTPRDCPRVTYHVAEHTTEDDKARYLSSESTCEHVVAIEHDWVNQMANTTLTIYEFDPTNFVLQDRQAGYYVSDQSEVPIASYTVDDLFAAHKAFSVELRVVDRLWDLRDAIIPTSFYWSMCRMGFAQKKEE